MKEVYTIMSATLGVPPSSQKSFVWEFYDKDGKPGRWEGTPKQFYASVASGQYKVRAPFLGGVRCLSKGTIALGLVLTHQ